MLAALLVLSPLPPLWIWASAKSGSRLVGAGLAFLLWATWGLATTELLGAFWAWRAGALWIAWGGAFALALMLAWRVRSHPQPVAPAAPPGPRGWLVVGGALLALPIACNLARALLAAPNSPDGFNYHLVRQLYWLQAGGLGFSADLPARLQVMPPLAEILQAHFLILSFSDRFAALPQFLAWLVFVAAAAALCRELGGGRPALLAAAVLAATVPMAYQQGSGCKNDITVATFITLAGLFALRLRTAAPARFNWLGLGLALGLACTTKAYAPLWLLLPALAVAGAARRAPTAALLACGVALALPAPHYLRNLSLYGSPFGNLPAEQGGDLISTRLTPAALASSALRNVSLHLAAPAPAWNAAVSRQVRALLQALDEDPDSPDTTMRGMLFSVLWQPNTETTCGAPLHGLLGLVALALLARRGPVAPGIILCAGFAAGGFLLHCLLLKWQPWGARLQLPLFAPLCALIPLIGSAPAAPRQQIGLMLLATLGWLPFAENLQRPLWSGRTIWTPDTWRDWVAGDADSALGSRPASEVLRASGARSLWVDNVTEGPYPIYRDRALDRDNPLLLCRSPRTPTGAPPDAVLAFPHGENSPFVLRSYPERDYTAGGETWPWLLYLPRDAPGRPAGIGRPAFGGWIDCHGLAPPATVSTANGPLAVRVLSDLPARFVGEASPRPLAIEMLVMNGTAGATLAIDLDGREVTSLPLAAARHWQAFTLALPARGTRWEFALRLGTGIAGRPAAPLLFRRLRVVELEPTVP